MASEKADDRAAQALRRDTSESAGWFDDVLELDDLHGEADEVCAPYVENEGFGFQFRKSFFGESAKWDINIHKEGQPIVKALNAARRAPKKKGEPDAGTEGLSLHAIGEYESWVVNYALKTGGGYLLGFDRTDVALGDYQLDARFNASTMDAEDEPQEMFAAKISKDFWSVKTSVTQPEEGGSFFANPVEYLARGGRNFDCNLNLSDFSPWLRGVSCAARVENDLEFSSWGINNTQNASDNKLLQRLGLAKVTTAVTFNKAEDATGVERFVSRDLSSYSLSASAELESGRMVGVTHNEEGTTLGFLFPFAETKYWKSASLRVRGFKPSDDEDLLHFGVQFAWERASYFAQLCLQLRSQKTGSFNPRLWFHVDLAPDGDDD
eukprot:Hpha_TRINITY_DN9556_c0_g1::TRINITY_DN9556_c0_g1_i1::g.114924::m.114924